MRVVYREDFPLSLINENDREFQPKLDYDEDAIKKAIKRANIGREGGNPIPWSKNKAYFLHML